MIFRIHDEEHAFPACHRAGHGEATVDWIAAPADEDGHIRMIVGSIVFSDKWGAMSVYMSPSEARELAKNLAVAVAEVEPYYGA